MNRWKSHFADLSADMQKFFSALCNIEASNPTGVNGGNILSMAIALQTGKCTKLDYNYKNYYRDNWIGFKEFTVLQEQLK